MPYGTAPFCRWSLKIGSKDLKSFNTGNRAPQVDTHASKLEMWAIFVLADFTCCSLLVPHWGPTRSWELMSPSRLSRWTLELQNSAGVGNPCAFIQRQFDGLGQNSMPPYLPLCTPNPLRDNLLSSSHTPPSLEPGANFSFELTEDRGAALLTRHKTHMLDAELRSVFEEYTKRHYKSWVKFVEKYGKELHPVLVAGFDLTKDFELMTYSAKGVSLEAGASISVPAVATASASIWNTRHIKCSPRTNKGPWQDIPLPDEQTIELPSSQSAGERNIPSDFNQCVFIRYYTMRTRLLFPDVIRLRAGAGPHDLGSGDSEGDTFPEIAVHSSADLMATGDEDLSGQQGLAADGEDSESDVVVCNTPV